MDFKECRALITGGQADRRTGGQADKRTGGQADNDFTISTISLFRYLSLYFHPLRINHPSIADQAVKIEAILSDSVDS